MNTSFYTFRFAHLISIDFFNDLFAVLSELIESEVKIQLHTLIYPCKMNVLRGSLKLACLSVRMSSRWSVHVSVCPSMYKIIVSVNLLPDMPILGSSNSAANKDMMS